MKLSLLSRSQLALCISATVAITLAIAPFGFLGSMFFADIVRGGFFDDPKPDPVSLHLEGIGVIATILVGMALSMPVWTGAYQDAQES